MTGRAARSTTVAAARAKWSWSSGVPAALWMLAWLKVPQDRAVSGV